MFSKQATDKLDEVFTTAFRTAPGHGDDQRKDSMDNPKPTVAGVEPPTIAAGSDTVTLRLHGEDLFRTRRFALVGSIPMWSSNEQRPR